MLLRLQDLSNEEERRSRSLLTISEEGAMLCKGTKTFKAVMLAELMKEEGSKWTGFFGGGSKRSRGGEDER